MQSHHLFQGFHAARLLQVFPAHHLHPVNLALLGCRADQPGLLLPALLAVLPTLADPEPLDVQGPLATRAHRGFPAHLGYLDMDKRSDFFLFFFSSFHVFVENYNSN